MIVKAREEPLELKLWRILVSRMRISEHDIGYYHSLDKGFQGELQFDYLIKNLRSDILILNDLLFEHNHTIFQIDSLLITGESIFLIEVKNYDGDYYIEGEKWYPLTTTEIKREVKNPLLQLKRTESMFIQLLHHLGFSSITSTVKSQLVFVNPNFFLYHAPLQLPIIFPTQIQRFINNLGDMSAKKNRDIHHKLVDSLVSIHLNNSPYNRLPQYNFDQLKKGIPCKKCSSFINEFTHSILICQKCGFHEKTSAAVLRCVEEYALLFPDHRITKTAIYDWCNIVPTYSIRKILSRHFKLMGQGKSSYYV
ncbi:MAG: NERD domain-containing protein [Bacillaceae bacterium]|nr:NERD domain-containing protein [Bacillaceae bacterium]